MENIKNQTKRLSEMIILLIVLVCAALILAEITGNIATEIRTTLESTTAPLQTLPTLPADMEPTPFVIPG